MRILLKKKLDRDLINAAWLRAFPQSSSCFEAGGISDHARCVLQLSSNINEERKPFCFSTISLSTLTFLQWSKEWDSTQPIHHFRSALRRFHTKLKLLKYDMRMLNKTHYGDLPNRTKEDFEEMCQCQNMALLDPNRVTFAAAAEASDRWNKLASIEKKFFRQKSCIRCLGAGDHNTFFFSEYD